MSSTILKRPTGVYILAILFLFAPIGNILISFAGSGVHNWYDYDVILPFLNTVPAWDRIWLGLLFVTGILLFFPHKLSWSLAIATLCLVLAVNAFRLYSADAGSIDPAFLKIFSIMATLSTLTVLVISFYFRFPYLDRRANWFTKEERLDVRTEVKINGVKAATESISSTGCKVNFETVMEFSKSEKVKLKFSEISGTEVEATVVEVAPLNIRVEFESSEGGFKRDLGRWIKSRLK